MPGAWAYLLAKDYADLNKKSIISSGFPFPPGLIAFWDFSEPNAPYYSKAGVDNFPLTVGGTEPISVSAEPFGRGLQFNGSTDYLIIPNSDVGSLDIGKVSDEVTVIAWVYCPNNIAGFIAGMWQEDDNDPQRQYGLFGSLPTYGGARRVCGHVSKTGGASPNLPYSRDYSTTGTLISNNRNMCIGFTYDGNYVKSYLNGISDKRPVYTEPEAPTGEGLTYSKNPYAFDLGLNRKSTADFTVGACKLTSDMSNFFNGVLCGLAVFDRALTEKEMAQIYAYSLDSEVVYYHDFNIIGTSAQHAGEYGWLVAGGASATDRSMGFDDWTLTRLVDVNKKPFVFRQNKIDSGIITTTGFSNIRLGQISKIEFLMNNKLAGDGIRLCVKVGDNWYATASKYDSGAVGVSGADWTTAVLMSVAITRDKTEWLELDFVVGSTLNLGTQPANDLQNEEVTAIGFLSDPVQTDGIIRISDLKVYM